MPTFIERRADQSLSALGSWVLLLAVVIAQVQLPIPVVHDHESVQSPIALATHLDTRHAGFVTEECGFHWHWVLPRQPSETPCNGDGSLPVPAAPSCDASVVSTACFAASALTSVQPTLGPAAWREFCCPVQRRFATDFSPRSSSVFCCAVLCVIRC